MKRLTILFFTFFISFSLLSQKPKGYVALYQTSDLFFNLTETNLDLGISFPLNRGVISFMVSYKYGGNVGFDSIPAYKMDYHLFGGGLKYRLLDRTKRYSPTIRLSVLTEIRSNYRGKKLGNHNYGENFEFFPWNEIGKDYHYDGSGISGVTNSAFDYISTPLMGGVFIGNELRIIKTLYLNLEIGYQFRAVRIKYKEWSGYQEEPLTPIIETHKLKTTENGKVGFAHYFEFSVGISYTFPFKKEKPQP